MRTIAMPLLCAAVATVLSVPPAAADSDDLLAGAIAGAAAGVAAGALAGSVFAAPPPQVYVYAPIPAWTRPVPQPPVVCNCHRDGWDEDSDEDPRDDDDWGH